MYGMPERMRAYMEKCGEFSNKYTTNQSLSIFLLLHAIEGAINFGTPCISLSLCQVGPAALVLPAAW